MGRDPDYVRKLEFQSTPPVRGATAINLYEDVRLNISIHAPRAGGDKAAHSLIYSHGIFQSTPPVRGATDANAIALQTYDISIHAPRAGGDYSQAFSYTSA